MQSAHFLFDGREFSLEIWRKFRGHSRKFVDRFEIYRPSADRNQHLNLSISNQFGLVRVSVDSFVTHKSSKFEIRFRKSEIYSQPFDPNVMAIFYWPGL